MSIQTFTREDRISPDVTEALEYVSPEPWETKDDGPDGLRIIDNHKMLVANGISVESDARFIAAAPELLKAAIALLARIDHITTEDFGLGGERQEREQLRAMIAKALGLPVEVI